MERITAAPTQIHYPERDGKPMGETDVHIDALIYLREALRDHVLEPKAGLSSRHWALSYG